MSKPTTADAYRLFHEGSLALAEVEAAGIRVDVPRLERTIAEVREEVAALEAELRRGEEWRLWRRRFGERANLGSRAQLAEVLFREMGLESAGWTEGTRDEEDEGRRRHRTDEEALRGLQLPFVDAFLKVESLKKLGGTFLEGLRREVVGGYVHPMFSLNTVRTYRSSSERPNLQNQMKRDAEHAERLRRCFVPRDGHVLLEVDYSALEWKVAACFFRDRAMVEYASDPTLDVHRDMAMECYLLGEDEWTKECRSLAKNQFVFPTLYGSWWPNTARGLWEAIGRYGLKARDGRGLLDRLRDENGISELGLNGDRRRPSAKPGSFAAHVAGVEERFRGRFPEWARRKETWVERYRERGWFDTMTGFRCTGVYTRNKLLNYPVQGPAFHLLLWSLIQVVRWLRENRMRSRVICQIHDAKMLDVHREELDDVLEFVVRVMTVDVRRHWPWVIVPLWVAAEVGERDWWEMRKVLT